MQPDPDQPCFLRVPIKCLPTVVGALRKDGYENEAKAVERFTRHYTDPALNARRIEWVARADAEAREGEVEFDSDATISESEDNGQYVLGWVWVDGPNVGGPFVCQNCGEGWEENDLRPVKDVFERVLPGEPMPAGECPACGAVCHEE